MSEENKKQLDSRSVLEKRFDSFGACMLPSDMVKLILILKNERDAWRDTCKNLERERLTGIKRSDHHA